MSVYRSSRAKKLGITADQYAALLAAQGGHCALCPSVPKKRLLHVDHDHATGKIRGLLCMRCNRNLPTWITVGWLFRAASYLGPWSYSRRGPWGAVLDDINGIGKDEKP